MSALVATRADKTRHFAKTQKSSRTFACSYEIENRKSKLRNPRLSVPSAASCETGPKSRFVKKYFCTPVHTGTRKCMHAHALMMPSQKHVRHFTVRTGLCASYET